MNRAQRVEAQLREGLEAEHIEVEDDSARHAGHAGAADGGSHFNVVVVSSRFVGLSRVARHRAVYKALESMMGADIHALSARTLTPEEWGQSDDSSSL